MKLPFKRGAISYVPLKNAVLCADCECISESTTDACGVCGGGALVNLGRLLGSAQGESASAAHDSSEFIAREVDTLADPTPRAIHAVPRRSI